MTGEIEHAFVERPKLSSSRIVLHAAEALLNKLSVMLTANDAPQTAGTWGSVHSFKFDYIWSSVVGPTLEIQRMIDHQDRRCTYVSVTTGRTI